MGYSKKGVRMKITNQGPSFQKTQSKAYTKTGEFAGFLDDATYSGDDYYRQHQSQLQPSELEFNPMEVAQTKVATQVEIRTRTDDVLLIEKEGLITTPQPQISPGLVPQKTEQPADASTIHSLHTAQNTRAPVIALNQPKKSIESRVSAQETERSFLAYTPEFKKHHLYIKQDEAELTLNTQNLKPEEEQAFIPMIKNYIKNKGLLLKRLIINGVHHD
jgi:hypothetical protein